MGLLRRPAEAGVGGYYIYIYICIDIASMLFGVFAGTNAGRTINTSEVFDNAIATSAISRGRHGGDV